MYRLALFLMLTGCGIEFDYQTEYRFRVIDNGHGTKSKEIDAIFKKTATEVANLRNGKYTFVNIKEKTRIYEPFIEFVDNLDCFSEDCNGYATVNFLKIVHNTCLPKTSLAHEFLHMIEIQIEDKYDYDHKDKTYWGLESKIADSLITEQNLCQ